MVSMDELEGSYYEGLSITGWWSSLWAQVFDAGAEQLSHGPDVIGEACGHERRRGLCVSLGQGLVRAAQMVVAEG